MKSNLSFFLLALVALVTITSCQKERTAPTSLLEDQFKDMTRHGGISGNIKIQAPSDWTVDYVKLENESLILKDISDAEFRVINTDTVVAKNGWFRMAKSSHGDSLFIDLKENFENVPRILVIGLKANGKEEEMRITQHRGKSYKIIDKKISEIDSLRRIYVSSHQCKPQTFSNYTSIPQKFSDRNVFWDVQHSSIFKSEDYGAFLWMSERDSTLMMEDLIIDGTIVWTGRVSYRNGTSNTPYQRGAVIETQVNPNETITLNGEVKYVERTSHYVFTIQNEEAGNQFEITGTWKQTVPISSTLLRN
ncbi:hypothetical protein ACFSQ3_13230 [Sphingobacterium corticis]|uniref:Uncharacterized protein n=1 Tax=Sphingobacterium corticis TaxID=1812823 RepID=A0ABW5NM39_9SPHI